jgi:hypothetical protein
MNLFWKYIARYPRFLITSVSGLVIIILSPLLKLAKKNLKNQLVLLLFLSLTIIFIIILLNNMLNL